MDESSKIRARAGWLLILVVLWLPAAAFADRALHCQGQLVGIGDLKADVRSKCGAPDHIEQWEENPRGHTFQIYDSE